jgi:voltage-gated potassium channel
MAGKLYTPQAPPSLKSLVMRLLLILALIFGVTMVVHFEGGLIETRTGEPPSSLWHSLYYSIITITTVGYGDIVPVTLQARLVDIFLLTPIRLVFFFTVLNTAYEIVIRRFREEYRMKRAVGKLKNHIIICGFGRSGRAALTELLMHKNDPACIVVVDENPDAMAEAAEAGVVCVSGDASREHVLESVGIEKASHVLVCPGRDDAAVLITLTVRALNPGAGIIAMCHEAENLKLVERSGASHTVNPAVAGGSLMASATRHAHLMETLKDMLSVGGSLRLDERRVKSEEVGKNPAELPGITVVRIYRGTHFYNVSNLPELDKGDVLVYLRAGQDG